MPWTSSHSVPGPGQLRTSPDSSEVSAESVVFKASFRVLAILMRFAFSKLHPKAGQRGRRVLMESDRVTRNPEGKVHPGPVEPTVRRPGLLGQNAMY